MAHATIGLPSAVKHLLTVARFIHTQPSDVSKSFAMKTIIGNPGIGKTELPVAAFNDLATQLSTDDQPVELFVETPLVSGFTEADVRGFPFPQKIARGGVERLVAVWAESSIIAPLWEAHERITAAGKTPLLILFFDELFQCSDSVMKPLGQIFTEHRIGPHQLPPRTILFAASNLMSNKTGVVRQMPHITNRMSIVRVALDLAVWKEWAVGANVHYLYTSFAARNPSLWNEPPPAEANEPYATIRSLTNCSRFHSLFPDPQASHLLDCSTDMVHEVGGYLGPTVASQFISHCQLGSELPEYEDIMADPEGCRLPKEAAPQAQLMFYLPSLCPPAEQLSCLDELPGFGEQPASVPPSTQTWTGPGSISADEVFERLLRYTERMDATMKGRTYAGFMAKLGGKLLRHPRLKDYIANNAKMMAMTF